MWAILSTPRRQEAWPPSTMPWSGHQAREAPLFPGTPRIEHPVARYCSSSLAHRIPAPAPRIASAARAQDQAGTVAQTHYCPGSGRSALGHDAWAWSGALVLGDVLGSLCTPSFTIFYAPDAPRAAVQRRQRGTLPPDRWQHVGGLRTPWSYSAGQGPTCMLTLVAVDGSVLK